MHGVGGGCSTISVPCAYCYQVQQARAVHPIPVYCCLSVTDGGPILSQHWVNVSYVCFEYHKITCVQYFTYQICSEDIWVIWELGLYAFTEPLQITVTITTRKYIVINTITKCRSSFYASTRTILLWINVQGLYYNYVRCSQWVCKPKMYIWLIMFMPEIKAI